MESKHDKRKEYSSVHVLKKCYSLPILQKENEKLKNDLKLLQADRDEKDVLLTESLQKMDLLEKQNHDLEAVVTASKKKVVMKDASTGVAMGRPGMKDATTFVKIIKKNVSTSTSAYSGNQVEKENKGPDEALLLTESLQKMDLLEKQNHVLEAVEAASKEKVVIKDASTCVAIAQPAMNATTFVKIRKKNVSTSTSADSEPQVEQEDEGPDEARCKPIQFDVTELPYEEVFGIECFDMDMADPQLSLFMLVVSVYSFTKRKQPAEDYSNINGAIVICPTNEHFHKIGGVNVSKKVNNILNCIATKQLLKKFVWDKTASNSFQNLKNIVNCIHSVVCSRETTQVDVNRIIKNAIKNARATK